MGFIEWATSPLGQNVPIHIAWFLIWVALIAGMLFLVVHAIYIRYFAKEKEFAADTSPKIASQLPARIPRHSLTARLFHWVMAASMFTLLFTAFLPKVGVQFDWVTYHWIAGTCADRFHHFSHHPCLFLSGFLVDLAGPGRSRGRMEAGPALHGKVSGAAAEIRQVSAGEQALSRRHHRDRVVGDRDRRVHDVARTHHLLSAQSLFVQRHDLGADVRAARPGRRRTDHTGDRARLFCGPAREAAHYRLHDRRYDEPGFLS